MTSRTLRSTEQKRLHREWRRRTEQRLGLILDSVQTPYNVGSIVRTAAAFRVEHLWLAGATPPLTHPKVGKTALGTERFLTATTAPTGTAAVVEAQAAGFTVIGIELATDARPLADVLVDGPVCVVVGHEEHGVLSATLDACDEVAFIPTPGKVGSLNVAIAAGIALYEVRRREWTA